MGNLSFILHLSVNSCKKPEHLPALDVVQCLIKLRMPIIFQCSNKRSHSINRLSIYCIPFKHQAADLSNVPQERRATWDSKDSSFHCKSDFKFTQFLVSQITFSSSYEISGCWPIGIILHLYLQMFTSLLYIVALPLPTNKISGESKFSSFYTMVSSISYVLSNGSFLINWILIIHQPIKSLSFFFFFFFGY